MRHHIISEIERRRAELATLDQRRLVIDAQLNVLEDLLKLAPPDDASPRAPVRSRSPTNGHGRLGDRWLSVLAEAVRRHPNTVRSDEVPAIQTAAGHEPAKPTNVRSHFWMNAKPGKFYERVASGEYRATAAGAKMVGLPLGGGEDGARHSNGASPEPAPSPSFENRGEPQSTASARFDLLNPNKAAMPGGGT